MLIFAETSGVIFLLHFMCGYQCDKPVTKNDTHEVIWYHFTAAK